MASAMVRFRRAAKRVKSLEGDLAKAREELHAALIEARAEGATMQQLADEMGVTRQRVAMLLRELGQ